MEKVNDCSFCGKLSFPQIFKCKTCNIKMRENPCPMFKECYKCDFCHIVHRNRMYISTHKARNSRNSRNRKTCWKCHRNYETTCREHEKICLKTCANIN